MSKLNINSPFFQFVNTFVDFVLLNLLWIICCIPLVTIGASTTALYYVTMKTAREEHSYIAKSFFQSFKANLKQSTIVWIIFFALGAVLLYNLSFWYTIKSTISTIILIVVGIISLIYVFSLLYVFPLLARFSNSTKQLLKNAPLISIQNLKSTIILLVINVLLVTALYLVPQFAIFMVVFGFAFFAYVKSYIYVKVFKCYEPHEDEVLDNNDSLFTDATTNSSNRSSSE